MNLAFTTLGAPTWTLKDVCTKGPQYGFTGVDFRGLNGPLDITKLPEFTSDLARTRQSLDNAGLKVTGVSTSIRLADDAHLFDHLEEARRTTDVALGLGAPNIRCFGGDIGPMSREQAIAISTKCLDAILVLPNAHRLNWLLETHDDWCSTRDCVSVVKAASNHAAVGMIWDIEHTYFEAQESIDESLNAGFDWMRYVHIKDATKTDKVQLMQPGEGSVPLREAIAKLSARGYAGWYLFEHEKRWVPTLPDPEVAFPKFVEWARTMETGERQ